MLDHLGQFEPVQLVALHGGADQAAALAHHEGDDLGGDLLGGDDEVALVLAVLVVDDDHRPAGRDVADGLLDGVEPEGLLEEGVEVGDGQMGGHAVAPSRAGAEVVRERWYQS